MIDQFNDSTGDEAARELGEPYALKRLRELDETGRRWHLDRFTSGFFSAL